MSALMTGSKLLVAQQSRGSGGRSRGGLSSPGAVPGLRPVERAEQHQPQARAGRCRARAAAPARARRTAARSRRAASTSSRRDRGRVVGPHADHDLRIVALLQQRFEMRDRTRLRGAPTDRACRRSPRSPPRRSAARLRRTPPRAAPPWSRSGSRASRAACPPRPRCRGSTCRGSPARAKSRAASSRISGRRLSARGARAGRAGMVIKQTSVCFVARPSRHVKARAMSEAEREIARVFRGFRVESAPRCNAASRPRPSSQGPSKDFLSVWHGGFRLAPNTRKEIHELLYARPAFVFARNAHGPRLQRAHRRPVAPRFPQRSPAPICWSRRRPAAARPPPSCCRRLHRPAGPRRRRNPPPPAATARAILVLDADARARAAGREGRPHLRRRPAPAHRLPGGRHAVRSAAQAAVAKPVDVVIATPGRLKDHLDRGRIDLGRVEVLVLDEADRMLDMGFTEDIDAIVARIPGTRQTLLFSATLEGVVGRLAQRVTRNPQRIDIAATAATPTGRSTNARCSPTTCRTRRACSTRCCATPSSSRRSSSPPPSAAPRTCPARCASRASRPARCTATCASASAATCCSAARRPHARAGRHRRRRARHRRARASAT